MRLKYYSESSSHVSFQVLSFCTGGYEFTPDTLQQNTPRFLLSEILSIIPKTLDAGIQIDAYQVTVGGLQLDYLQYTPIGTQVDDLSNFYDPLKTEMSDILATIIMRRVIVFYRKPGEAPAVLNVPNVYETPQGRHYYPSWEGGWQALQSWVMGTYLDEGWVINLDMIDFALGVPCDVPGDTMVWNGNTYNIWHDGRVLCLQGGGFFPLAPQTCLYPTLYGGETNFCISTAVGSPQYPYPWNGQWNKGFGNVWWTSAYPSERGVLMSPDNANVFGCPVTNSRNSTMFPTFFSATQPCTEFVSVMYAGGSFQTPFAFQFELETSEYTNGGGGTTTILVALALLGSLFIASPSPSPSRRPSHNIATR